MQTVVKFIKNEHDSTRNKVVARTLRKVSFIDDRYLASRNGMPRFNEHWLVEIVRENLTNRPGGGGSFVVKPIQPISDDDLAPLVHGSYDMRTDEDALILTPRDMSRFWVMSPEAKKALMRASSTEEQAIRALVISHGGEMWQRRRPPESVMQAEAKKLLKDLED